MNGDFLFKYRGQIPILFFFIVIPFIYYTDYTNYSKEIINYNMVLSFLISLIGLIIRAYTVGTTPAGTSGRNRKKQIAKTLNKTGIYSIVRNPLYLGNFLIWLGISIYTLNVFFILCLNLFFFIYYIKIINAEEKFLERKFKNEFLFWKKITPKLFPSVQNYKKSNYSFSIKTILKREYSSFLATVVSFFYIQILINYFNQKEIIINEKMWIIIIFSISITLILRTLKKHTSILDQEGRT